LCETDVQTNTSELLISFIRHGYIPKKMSFRMASGMILKVEAVTFDDFYTLRYPVGKKENIVYPVLKALKGQGLDVNDEEFLKQYFRADKLSKKAERDSA
jgi:hypothetical protein